MVKKIFFYILTIFVFSSFITYYLLAVPHLGMEGDTGVTGSVFFILSTVVNIFSLIPLLLLYFSLRKEPKQVFYKPIIIASVLVSIAIGLHAMLYLLEINI